MRNRADVYVQFKASREQITLKSRSLHTLPTSQRRTGRGCSARRELSISIKSKVLAVEAMLTVAGGGILLAAPGASALPYAARRDHY